MDKRFDVSHPFQHQYVAALILSAMQLAASMNGCLQPAFSSIKRKLDVRSNRRPSSLATASSKNLRPTKVSRQPPPPPPQFEKLMPKADICLGWQLSMAANCGHQQFGIGASCVCVCASAKPQSMKANLIRVCVRRLPFASRSGGFRLRAHSTH